MHILASVVLGSCRQSNIAVAVLRQNLVPCVVDPKVSPRQIFRDIHHHLRVSASGGMAQEHGIIQRVVRRKRQVTRVVISKCWFCPVGTCQAYQPSRAVDGQCPAGRQPPYIACRVIRLVSNLHTARCAACKGERNSARERPLVVDVKTASGYRRFRWHHVCTDQVAYVLGLRVQDILVR